jgi:hypothetical protein
VSEGPLEPRDRSRERPRPAPPPAEGVRCPYCHDGFAEGLARAGCWACKAAHHARCFAEHGGCSVFGCEGAPRGAAPRPIVIRTFREQAEDEDWRVARRRERAAFWSELQREWNRTSGALLGIVTLLPMIFIATMPMPPVYKLPLLALLGSFLATCVADVVRPTDADVGRALGMVHRVSGGDDAWMR